MAERHDEKCPEKDEEGNICTRAVHPYTVQATGEEKKGHRGDHVATKKWWDELQASTWPLRTWWVGDPDDYYDSHWENKDPLP